MKINLDELNPGQREAVEFKDGVAVIASVAGSGKTKVLTSRVAYLIGYHEVMPDNILLTTFSKQAGEELKERMAKIINKRLLDSIVMGTFHSVALRILRHEYKALKDPLQVAFDPQQRSILMGKPQQWMVEGIMKDVGIDLNDKNSITSGEVLHTISLAKNSLLDVGRFSIECVDEEDFQIAEIYRLYEEKKKEDKVVDFDDMLLLLYKLFKKHPRILAKYQKKFQYIMVDEAQDNNFAQYELIEMLGKPHDNVYIVGDDDQSMYGFRGARPEEFVNFKKRYDEVKIIHLGQNYRSVPSILEVSNKLIEKNTIRIPKKLIPFRQPSQLNDEVTFSTFDNEDTESERVASEIVSSIEKGAKYKENAVLFRTNAQSRAIEDHFIRNSIPYVIYGGISFYERKEVKDIIAYMRLAINPHDDEAFKRVVNTPSRYLGAAFIRVLEQNAKRKRCSLYDSLKTAQLTPIQHRNGMQYFNLINDLSIKKHSSLDAEGLIKIIREKAKYDDFMRKESQGEDNDNDVLENLTALESSASKHKSPKDFINFINLLTKSKVKNADAVQVMTIHKSKGLEFKQVFVIGYSEHLLPHRFAVDSGDLMAIEEERRLAYVALTRAQDKLHVYSTNSYNGKGVFTSRFATDCGFIKEEEEKEES